MPVVDQRIPPPAVGVAEKRPRVGRSHRPLGVTAQRELEPERTGDLNVNHAAEPLSLEVVAVIPLQEDRRPSHLADREWLFLNGLDDTIEPCLRAEGGGATDVESNADVVAEVAAQA